MSATARRGLDLAAERAPVERWADVRAYLETTWEPGQHVSIFGPTGRGKSTVLIELCELPGHQPAVLLVTKRRDAMIARLSRRGWIVCRSLGEVNRACRLSWADRWSGKRELDAKVVYWPQAGGSIKQRRATLASAGEEFFDWAYNRGNLTVGVDEALYVIEDLRLAGSLRTLWHEGRSSGVSLLVASQRPSWLPKSAYSSPTYLLMFGTNDPDDLRRLGDVGGGLRTKELRTELQLVGEHELILAAPRDVPAWYVRTTVRVPQRKAA